jgi:hypothetical protein
MPASRAESAAPPSPGTRIIVLGWVGVIAVYGLVLVYYLLVATRVTGGPGLPLDDGWIHARFAQNLARGQGFSFNPGEPTSTTTSPLWTLLLALVQRLVGDPFVAGLAANLVLGLLLLAIVYRLSRAFVPNTWLAFGAAVVVAATVPLPWWVLSGMEPPLYACLALLGLLLHLAWRESPGLRGLAPTFVFALAALARPEMLLLFPLAMLDRLLMSWLTRQEGALRRWAAALARHLPIYLALLAPLFIYNHRVSGYLLPTSFYSKLQRVGIPGALADPRVTWTSALVTGPSLELWGVLKVWASDNGLLLLPFLFGLGWLVWQAVRGRASGARSLLVPMLLVIQPVAWALVGGYRPPEYQSQRYLADLNPLYLLVGLLGGWLLTERAAFLRKPLARVVLLVAVLAVSLLRQPAGARTYALNVKNTNEMQVTIGRWLRANAPADSLLAVNDIGAIGYVSDMRVLDLQGLVTPEILPLRDMKHRLAGTAPQAVFDFLASRRPDYLVIFPEWYPDLHFRSDLFTPVFDVRLKDNITNGADWMVVYRTAWADAPQKRAP